MPIPINTIETTVPVVTEQVLACDSLNIDTLTIDGTGHDDPTKPPTLKLSVTPYKAGTPNQYAGQAIDYQTANIYAAAANVPEVGAAIEAVFAAVAAWHAYRAARQADYDAAQAAAVAAYAASDAMDQSLAAAVAARDAAFEGRTGVDDPLWTNANTAWRQADAAAVTARAVAVAAIDRLRVAQAAVDDPANPPLVSEAT